MYRVFDDRPEFFLVHPGGPFWQNKDKGSWSIPKGEVGEGEDIFEAAKREFQEETGIIPTGKFFPLKPIRQKSGKIVYAWAFEGDVDPRSIKSNLTSKGWPEVDKADFFFFEKAKEKINPAQIAFLEELLQKLRQSSSF